MIIVTSGCSFTNCGMTWPYHLKGHDVRNVGTVGAGNRYISRAAMYECESLIKEGINVDDIFLIVMWSGIDRTEFLSTKDNIMHKDYITGDEDRWWLANFVHGMSEDDSVWLKSSGAGQIGHYKNIAVNDLFKSRFKLFFENQQSFFDTLECIIMLQNYCELKGIKYKFSCWQNIFNDYRFKIPKGYNREGEVLWPSEFWTMVWLDNTHWQNNRYFPKEIKFPISKETPLLKDVYKQTTHLWDLINFYKWWFYEDDQVELGGLAEWVLLSERDNWGMEHDPAHPKESSHEKFANKVVKEWIDA